MALFYSTCIETSPVILRLLFMSLHKNFREDVYAVNCNTPFCLSWLCTLILLFSLVCTLFNTLPIKSGGILAVDATEQSSMHKYVSSHFRGDGLRSKGRG